MPTLDIRGEKWDLWFQQIPTWPNFLTKAYWDKNKSILAKMTLATGIGEQLKATETIFKTASQKMPFMSGSRQADVDSSVKECQSYMAESSVKALHAELKALRDVAKQATAECQKNKLIPKATTQLCTDIAKAADLMMVCCNPNSLSGCISEAVKANAKSKAEKQRKMADPIIQNSKGVPVKILAIVGKMRQVLNGVAIEKARPVLSDQIFSCARDMTQPLANLLKCVTNGVDFDNFDQAEAQRLAKVLVPYGNGNAYKCADCSKEQIEAKLVDIEQAANDMKTLVSNVKVQA